MSKEGSTKSAVRTTFTGASLKKNPHAIHQMYGCKSSTCTICFYGMPMQEFFNRKVK